MAKCFFSPLSLFPPPSPLPPSPLPSPAPLPPPPPHLTDTVLKEHVTSFEDKQSRAHRRASRHSHTSRQRHKRPPPVSKVPTYTPRSSTHELEVTGGSRDVSPARHQFTSDRKMLILPGVSDRLGMYVCMSPLAGKLEPV